MKQAFKEEDKPNRLESRARIMFENLVFLLWKRNITTQKETAELISENSKEKITKKAIWAIIDKKRGQEGGLD